MREDLAYKYRKLLNYIKNDYIYFNAILGIESVIKFPMPENNIKYFYCDDVAGDISILCAERYNIYTLCIRKSNIFEVLHGYTIDKSPLDFNNQDKMDMKRYTFDNLEEAIKLYNNLTDKNIPLSLIELEENK